MRGDGGVGKHAWLNVALAVVMAIVFVSILAPPVNVLFWKLLVECVPENNFDHSFSSRRLFLKNLAIKIWFAIARTSK
jgi:hypothetical protein